MMFDEPATGAVEVVNRGLWLERGCVQPDADRDERDREARGVVRREVEVDAREVKVDRGAVTRDVGGVEGDAGAVDVDAGEAPGAAGPYRAEAKPTRSWHRGLEPRHDDVSTIVPG
jgi:hypothetical protein